MASLNMNDVIHAAVRRDLARTERALRSFPEGDRGRAKDIGRAWDALWVQLHHHHTGEDTYVFPYLRSLGPDAIDPGLLDEMDAEHEAMAESLTAATSAIRSVEAEPTSARARAATEAVAHATDVTDRHLRHEESAVIPVIDERSQTPQWKAVEKNLRRGTPAQAGQMFAWIQDGISPEIRAALRANVPGPVLFALTRLFGRSYRRDIAPVWRDKTRARGTT